MIIIAATTASTAPTIAKFISLAARTIPGSKRLNRRKGQVRRQRREVRMKRWRDLVPRALAAAGTRPSTVMQEQL